jgi:hypothetical protein
MGERPCLYQRGVEGAGFTNQKKQNRWFKKNDHSEKARAPHIHHTRTEGRAPVWGSEKPLHYRGIQRNSNSILQTLNLLHQKYDAAERVKRAAFFLTPSAMVLALFLTPRASWTQVKSS